MAVNKTQPTDASVEAFLNSVEDESKRADSFEILELMKKATGEPPKMWGPGMVGFGSYHYKYDSGREGDFFLAGFSPRKTALTLYVMAGFKNNAQLMSKLGKYKTGKACLYIKKLEDVDRKVLEELVTKSAKWVKENQSMAC